MHCRYFDITRNGNHSSFVTPTVVGGRCPLPSEICAQSDPPPFEKRRVRPIFTHNVSTVGDSEKSSITTNIKSTTGFPTSHRWSAYVTPKCPKGAQRAIFFAFEYRSQLPHFLVLFMLFIRILCCGDTSPSVEHVFSQSGLIIQVHRACITDQPLETL